jgi:Kdo2-lipid IVA lauroyltransferase/acyltransferase
MFFIRLISRLPLSVLYLLSDLLFFVGYYVIRYRRDVVKKNLKRSFPDKSDLELKTIERKFYHNLCDYPVEALKILTMSPKDIARRMIVRNPELIKSYMAQNQSMIFLTSHQFNWEWMLSSLSLSTGLTIYYVYQEQSSKFFDDFTHLIRMRFGPQPIKRERVAREVIRRRGTLHAVALLADQFPGPVQDKRYWTEFLNQDTAFFAGTDQIAIATQYPVFFFATKRLKRGYYDLEIQPLAFPPYKKDEINVVKVYASNMEKAIHRQPDNWLWSHDRWKRTRQEMGEA